VNSKLDNDDESYLHPDGTFGVSDEKQDGRNTSQREAELVREALMENPSMSSKDAKELVAEFMAWRRGQTTELRAINANTLKILGYDIVATPDDASIMRSECGTISLKHRKADGWGDEQWALDVHVNAHFHVTTYGATSKEVEEKAAGIIEETKQDCIVALRGYGEYA